MKKYLKFLFALILTTSTFSQLDTTKVAFVAYWTLGDSYDFKISKIKQKWKNGEFEKDEKQEYIANFTVIDSTETSYTIKWSYENDLENNFKIPQKLVNKFSKYKLTEIKYKTSEVGDFIEVLNWEEVSDIMSKMIDDIVEVFGENDEKKINLLSKAMLPLKQVYSSKKGIEEIVLKELKYFHFPMGLEFNVSEPFLYEDQLPNFFGGNPIKADAKIYFDSVDFEEGFCVMHHELKLNEADSKEMLNQFFLQAKFDEEEVKKAMSSALIKINDKNIFEYYFNPGIPHKIETNRETTIDINNEKSKSIEKVLIELIYKD